MKKIRMKILIVEITEGNNYFGRDLVCLPFDAGSLFKSLLLNKRIMLENPVSIELNFNKIEF